LDMKRTVLCAFLLFVAFSAGGVNAQIISPDVQGKTPVIIVPGITGSDLYNKRTKKQVWFRLIRPDDDDIRLPISPNLAANKDELEPRDIIRGVRIAKWLPEIEIYERLIYSLEARGRYREAKWDNPGKDGHRDTFYVFPYDWRRDNVESARQLIQKIEALKARLKKPNLKFNIIAHSMGGLVARYAAMYGNADIPAGDPVPTWAGAKHLDKILLVGTPNEGSILALRALVSGYSITSGIPLSLIQSFDRFDAFTAPSVFQLLPSNGSLVVVDEKFQKLDVDIFDPNTWNEYDWSLWEDPEFAREFKLEDQKNARPYFLAALDRAKRFHAALRAGKPGKAPVSYYLVGGDCKDTPQAALILYDEKNERWETVFRPRSFTRIDGTRVSESEVKNHLTTKGDGTVTLRSLIVDSVPVEERDKFLPVVGGMFQCEDHTKLVTSSDIQQKLISLLNQ
ncbi:MAG TPA: hypothetical protein VLA17_00015, partial [Candidatus Limnocylindria bacterium]|nr:hypothetical protein [Candidatus Limnocylindria bacterium]